MVKKATQSKKPAKEKEEEVSLTKAERVALVKAKVNKRFKGSPVIVSAADLTTTTHIRRPTGIVTLDRRIGGGFQAGTMSMLIGQKSSGKTYILNRTIANVQERYGDDACIAAATTEGMYDKLVAKKAGVRVAMSPLEIEAFEESLKRKLNDEELEWCRDQVGHFELIHNPIAEELLEATADVIDSCEFQIVSMDSMGALSPRAEAEAEEGLDQKHRGGAAAVITAFMHRLHAGLNKTDVKGYPNCTSFIAINQYRDKMGASKYENPMSILGGHALQHGSAITLLFESGGKIYADKEKKDFTVTGKRINWEVLKGKAGCHDGPKGQFTFSFDDYGAPYGADTVLDLVSALIDENIVVQAKSWLSVIGDDGDVILKAQGAENLAAKIGEDPELEQRLKDMVFTRTDVNFITREIWGFPDVSNI